MDIAGYGEMLPLASSASSDLYRTRLAAADRWVAVKVFRFALADERNERRYRRDGDLARSISTHPHIATLYDIGLTADRRPYLTMELVDGGSVADRLTLASHGRFSPAEVARVGVAVAEALEVAHGAGIVHRYLQPTNILLGPTGDPVVTELGVGLFAPRWEAAGYLDEAVPYHAAPEVLERSTAGPAADVYSLASTLHAMLTGTPPHRAAGVDSVSALLLRALQHEPPSLVETGVPAALDAVLRAGLATSTADRTPTAAAFGRALADLLPELDGPTAPEVVARPGPAPRPVAAAGPVRGPATEPVGGDEPEPVVGPGPVAADEPVAAPGPDVYHVAYPAEAASTALEPVRADRLVDEDRRRRRRALIIAGAAITVLVALAANALGSGDDDPASATGDPPAVEPSASTPRDPDPGPGGARDGVEVPSGLTVHTSDAGVQLEWDATDTDDFAVLVLSESAPPRVETTSRGPSLFVPAVDLRTDDGYCFAVARLDVLSAAGPDQGGGEGAGGDGDGSGPDGEGGGLADNIGPAFSPVRCIRGAAEDTIRTG